MPRITNGEPSGSVFRQIIVIFAASSLTDERYPEHRDLPRFREQDPPAGTQNVQRTGQDRRQPDGVHPGGADARRIARPRVAARASGTRQDDAREYHLQRNGGDPQDDLRAGARQARGSGRFADESQCRRRAFHRRNTPAQPDCRGVPVFGDGGLQDRHHAGQGAERPFDPDRVEPVHADRRYDSQRIADESVAGPVRDTVSPGILR